MKLLLCYRFFDIINQLYTTEVFRMKERNNVVFYISKRVTARNMNKKEGLTGKRLMTPQGYLQCFGRHYESN